ncbi:MAG: cation transporter [Bacteroidales bacterium]|nr:cation transporter [Candidatus Cryptobacteroides onthequi]
MTREKEIYKVTLVGGAVNVLLLLFKFVAGIVGHSSAMIADAVHSFSDFITDVVVIVFVRISSMPEDTGHEYGHGKYETLASTAIGLALLGVAIGIIISGAGKTAAWLRGEPLTSPGLLALAAAIVSIVLKEATFRYTVAKADRLDSQALRANGWHHRSDALSSIGTAAGIGGAILLGQRWVVLDPLASIVVGAFIVKVAVKMLGEGIGDLMERSLPDDIKKEIISIASSFGDIYQPHHLRTRRIGNHYAIEMHVRMDGDISLRESHQRATDIEKAIRERFGSDTHVTIHVEPVKEGE